MTEADGNAWDAARSLERRFYCSLDVFEEDFDRVIKTQWLMIDHCSRISKPGDYFLVDIGHENIVIVRQHDSSLAAFYNVCRHRGSRVCIKPEGNAPLLTCPYHAWSYNLDGTLRRAPMTSASLDKEGLGLKQVHCRTFEGFIFICLAKTPNVDFDDFVRRYRPLVEPSKLGDTKVAVRKRYPTEANWKLVVENFLECYHCAPAHPTYCSVHDRLKLKALGAGLGSGNDNDFAAYEPVLRKWEAEARDLGYPVGQFSDGSDSFSFQQGGRAPIGCDFSTETVRGRPAAPLLGDFKQYDGGRTVAMFNPFSCVFVNNDFAVAVRFTPRAALRTDVETMWLVRRDALEGRDYDPKELAHVWDQTLREDKVITENNQLGVKSAAYEPGPHSYLESRLTEFLAWYLRQTQQNHAA